MYCSTTPSHFPCAFRMYSTASRNAPSPPACSVTKWASSLTSFRALGTAIASQPCQGNSRTVVGIEALGFHIRLADEAETTLFTVPGGMLLSPQLGTAGRRKDPDFSVGQDPVYVK